MVIKTWNPSMSVEETKDLAYWERNVLALHFAEGWYYDDVLEPYPPPCRGMKAVPRYAGWRRVLSLAGGTITFHIPDDFDVGTLPEIAPNWDGHTTEEKWRRILAARGLEEVCDGCGGQAQQLVAVTDHPDIHDGAYCPRCVPPR